MTTIISETFADLHYDEEIPCFIIDWKGFQKIGTVQPFCEKVVDILREKRKENPSLTAFVGNTLDLKVVNENIQNYWNQEWNPAMYEVGGRFLALIVPTSVFAQFALDKYINSVEKNQKEIQVRFFDKIEDAKKWLADCQNTH